MIASHHLRRLTWLVLLALAGALVFGLTLRVNALKSEVRRAEQTLAALKREKMYLEVEFETRSNQQQLESWNDVDFGYASPSAGQYFADSRRLASLGRSAVIPAEPGEAGEQGEVRLATARAVPGLTLVSVPEPTAEGLTPVSTGVSARAAAAPEKRENAPVLAGRKIAAAASDPGPQRVTLAAVIEPSSDGEGLP